MLGLPAEKQHRVHPRGTGRHVSRAAFTNVNPLSHRQLSCGTVLTVHCLRTKRMLETTRRRVITLRLGCGEDGSGGSRLHLLFPTLSLSVVVWEHVRSAKEREAAPLIASWKRSGPLTRSDKVQC